MVKACYWMIMACYWKCPEKSIPFGVEACDVGSVTLLQHFPTAHDVQSLWQLTIDH